ncbi:hypothetical protein SB5439_05127 [Klebsiella variicola]|uniref:hypothetical protein n=1 Tax=Klebsiella variicola TaxID=244366 RepID=UPI00109CEC3A|nr:hypothetical protein [Klebsiella variicola]VGQ13012.1 hypothetical protein SB5439_05127 [Klebsiella variicola]
MNRFKPLALVALYLLIGCDDAPVSIVRGEEKFNSDSLARSAITGKELADLVTERVAGHEPKDKEQLKHFVSHNLAIVASHHRASEGAFTDAVEILIERYQLPR